MWKKFGLRPNNVISPKVSNLLHHLSLRRGIQVLRQNGFSPSCLKRRASPEEKERNSLPIEVSLWSNHRVMEWLRHVDLAEYAPNLRGSGVHGGLLIYEARFTAELFASLLSIPANKTLLRRHLGLHFRYAHHSYQSLTQQSFKLINLSNANLFQRSGGH